jgi:hypothetical protein
MCHHAIYVIKKENPFHDTMKGEPLEIVHHHHPYLGATVQVKSAPGHFGTYLHSQIGTYSNRHLVNSAPVMVNSAPVLKIIL